MTIPVYLWLTYDSGNPVKGSVDVRGREGSIYKIGNPFQHTKAGGYVLRLTADSSNNMCGRDGFLIHGDSIKNPGTASNGCIITSISDRITIHTSNDKILIVE